MLRSWRGRPYPKRTSKAGTPRATSPRPPAPPLAMGRPLHTQCALPSHSPTSRGRDRRDGPRPNRQPPTSRMGAPRGDSQVTLFGCSRVYPSVALLPLCPCHEAIPWFIALCPDTPGRPQGSPLSRKGLCPRHAPPCLPLLRHFLGLECSPALPLSSWGAGVNSLTPGALVPSSAEMGACQEDWCGEDRAALPQ